VIAGCRAVIQRAEADDAVQVLVFETADPDYFISDVDVTRIDDYRAEAAKLTGDASIALLAFGVPPGGGAAQHLARLMGRGRALEVMLSADDYDAELAERYGYPRPRCSGTSPTTDRAQLGSLEARHVHRPTARFAEAQVRHLAQVEPRRRAEAAVDVIESERSELAGRARPGHECRDVSPARQRALERDEEP
jgi:enoyl-CoA hydratase/carnithine racemase